MIEPVLLHTEPGDDFFDGAKANGISKIFYVQYDDELNISNMIDIKRSNVNNHYNIFATVTRADTFYWFDGNMIRKEEWIDLMMENHPDYYGWYLFHPEHMLGDAYLL